MRRYRWQMLVSRRRSRQLGHIVGAHFVGMTFSNSGYIAEWCLKEVSERNDVTGHRCWNWSGRSEKCFGCCFGLGGREGVVPWNELSAVEVDIYKRVFRSQNALVVELAERYSKKAK